MPNDPASSIHLVFTLLFVGVLGAGIFLLRNFERLFGPDPQIPSENQSSRAYSKLQILAIWAHAAALTGGFALLLH